MGKKHKHKGQRKNYTIIGRVNCRCGKEVDLRELNQPTKKQLERAYYWTQWAYCYHCGDYNRQDEFKVWNKNAKAEAVKAKEETDAFFRGIC